MFAMLEQLSQLRDKGKSRTPAEELAYNYVVRDIARHAEAHGVPMELKEHR